MVNNTGEMVVQRQEIGTDGRHYVFLEGHGGRIACGGGDTPAAATCVAAEKLRALHTGSRGVTVETLTADGLTVEVIRDLSLSSNTVIRVVGGFPSHHRRVGDAIVPRLAHPEVREIEDAIRLTLLDIFGGYGRPLALTEWWDGRRVNPSRTAFV